MTAAWRMTRTEIKLFLREPMAVFFTLVFPLMMLFLFGSIFGNDPDPDLGGRGSVDVSVPGYMAVIIATAGLLGLPINLASYRAQGVLRRFRATPIRPGVVLVAQLAVSLLFAAVGSLLLVVAGRVVFGLHLPPTTGPVLVAFLASSAGIFALGFVLASVLPNARTAQAVGMTVLFPMMFLSGAALPRQMLSATIQDVAQILPLTHVVSLIDDAWTGAGWNWPGLAVLAGVLVAGVAISVRAFRWE
ncbi:MAG: ABC transporter permease [Acidimicrobiales bacterium]